MLKSILIIFIFPISIWSMCEYPHNPPALCLSGKISSVSKLKHETGFKCLVTVDVKRLVRPAGVYTFDKNLKKVSYKKKTKLSTSRLKFYSNKYCSKGNVETLLEYSCSDSFQSLPDLSLVDRGSKKGAVLDSWNEKKTLINCGKYL